MARGFLAEWARQTRIAQREAERRNREGARRHAAAVRLVEQTRRAEERANAQAAKSAEVERKRMEKEAKQAHLDAKAAEVEEKNQAIAETLASIDNLLAATLEHDDYVDLNKLRITPKHPPFDRADLEEPHPAPQPVQYPKAPELKLPEAPRGFASIFGKSKHAEAVESAELEYRAAKQRWEKACREIDQRRKAEIEAHAARETERTQSLAKERSRYERECAQREADAGAANRHLEELKVNLGYGLPDAVQEYISIVLSNSVYPDEFPVSHEFSFDAATAELKLTVSAPAPNTLPTVKSYKYSKSSDEIVATEPTQKECRERYASAVHQVALRSFHEVFEADRRGLIQTIALEVGTNSTDPATGLPAFVPFVIAAASREEFMRYDLSAVVPSATLSRLGASVSKNPYTLTPATTSGARRV